MPTKISIKGKNKEFWEQALVYNTSPKILVGVITDMPDRLLERIAEELKCSIKGSSRHVFNIRKKIRGSGVTFTEHASGDYPYGITKHKTPEGEKYKPLARLTLKLRAWKREKKGIRLHLDDRFILRETDKHIFYGMRTKIIKHGDGHSIMLYWGGKSGEIALKQNKGFTGSFKAGKSKKTRKFKVPARQFIGLQPKLLDNLRVIYSKFVRSYGS